MPTNPSPFGQIRDLVDLAETYADDGAPQSATHNLMEARALLEGLLTGPPATAPTRSLEHLVDTVEGAGFRRTPEEIAAVPWIAQEIGRHDPRIGALGDLVETIRQQHQQAVVEWINRDWTCLCVTHCAEDQATACSLSGTGPHVHPPLPGHPGAYGPCPRHPDAPGDL